MDNDTENQSQLFINKLDRSTRNNIIKLDQKLKGLRAEIDAKMQYPTVDDDESLDEHLEKLSRISKEINVAISGIDSLVHLVSSNDNEAVSAFVQSEDMQQFSQLIVDYLEKITEIKKEF